MNSEDWRPEWRWHKYPDEKPKGYGRYLTCTVSAEPQIKQFGKRRFDDEGMEFLNQGGKTIAKGIIYWAEIPVPPNAAKKDLEIIKLKRQLESLKARIAKTEGISPDDVEL